MPPKKGKAKSKYGGVNLMKLDDFVEAHDNVSKLQNVEYNADPELSKLSLKPKPGGANLKKQDVSVNMLQDYDPDVLNVAQPGNSRKMSLNVDDGSKVPRQFPQKSKMQNMQPKRLQANMSPSNKKSKHFGRDELFDKFGVTDHYPIEEIIKLKSELLADFSISLSFYGVEQISDLVFYVLLMSKDGAKCVNVKSLDLTGCMHLTDLGMTWIALLFPKLNKINISGCHKVTETGLYQIVSKCSEMESVMIPGTSVTILPRKVADMTINTDGYPCISPAKDILEKNGVKIMQAAQYSKPENKDVVKICIIHGPGSTHSILKYMTGSSDKTLDPLMSTDNFDVSERFKANIVECDEMISDLFITKRALYILPISGKQEVKATARRLFGLITFIINKVNNAAFIVTGTKSDGVSLEPVINEVMAMVKKTSFSLKKTMEMDLKSLQSGSKIGNTLQEQETLMSKVTFCRALETIYLESMILDTAKPFKKGSEISKPFEAGMERVCEMYPEYQEIAGPIFQFILGPAAEKMLENGAVSMEQAKDTNQKIMELLAIMGRTLCLEIIQDVNMVCLISWLAKIVKTAFTPPTASTNSGKVMALSDSTPIWKVDDLTTELKKTFSQEKAQTGCTLLFKLGLSVYPNVIISPTNLQPEPNVPLEEFFPEIPPTEKRKDLFYTIGYKAEFDTPVPSFIVSKLLFLCTKIRRPQLIWKTGFIIQESFVETLFQWNSEHGAGSSICLYSHTLLKQGTVKEDTLQKTVWNTILQYKIVLEYVLQDYKIPHVITQVGGAAQDKKWHVSGLISNHRYNCVDLKKGDEGTDAAAPLVCSLCGTPIKATSLPWLLHSSVSKPFLQDKMITNIGDDSVKQMGNILQFTKGESLVRICSTLNATQQTSFSVSLIAEQTNVLRIGLGSGWSSTRSFSSTIVLDFQLCALVSTNPSDVNDAKRFSINKQSLPVKGDTVTFRLNEAGEKSSEFVNLNVYRNTEQIVQFTIPRRSYMPLIGTSSVKDKSVDTQVMIHPLYENVNDNSMEPVVGMRLEALDRKTPTLVCVATIADIYPDGKFLIHFDGWQSNYDYVTEPESRDLHPVGWMAANAHKYRNLSQTLQAPHRYHKSTFTWEEYCNDNDFLVVPYDWFSQEQIEETPITQYMSIIHQDGGIISPGDAKLANSCISSIYRTKRFEYNVIKRCVMTSEMMDFFTNHTTFFCLLPSGLDAQTLKHPSLQALMNFSKQNVHLLCPGIRTELLHFVDFGGTPLQEPDKITEMATYLQFCYVGLMIQGSVLPRKCSKLIPGIEKLEDKGQFEMWLSRMMFMYMNILEPHVTVLNQKGKVNIPQVATQEFTSSFKNSATKTLFQESGPYIRCLGHGSSFRTNSDLRQIPEKEFEQFYSFMTKLDFQNNSLEKLPDKFFENFSNLESLNVSNNKLQEIPEGLKNLKELYQFDISVNMISKLPADFDSVKDTLVSLNISDNPLNGMPKVVYQMVKLEELFAENIGTILDLSEIKNLKELQTLNIGKNCISKLPEELGSLPLTDLDVSGVPWFPLATFQSYRAFMLKLNMNHVTNSMTEKEKAALFKNSDIDESSTLTPNEVMSLNHDVLFYKYPRFGSGDLQYEKTGGIPSMILRLKTLKRLVMRYHGIKVVPDEIEELNELSELDIAYNPKLVSLSPKLGGIPIKQLHLQECLALNTPPKEIVARGFVAIMGYLKRLQLGASPCKRTKLMLVGLGGAGKTSLVQSLMNLRYRAYMDQDEPITDGIDITNWKIPIENNKDTLTFSVWDFAGQAVYYNTHQFFLSNRAVYLLLWNVRQGYEHAGLNFWLSSIACHAPKAPIVIVGTHIDKVEKFKLPEENLKSRYPQISGFHYVSCFTGDGIPALKEFIINETLKQKYMGERIPEAWLTLEKRIIQYREEKTLDILPFKTLDTIGNSCGVFDKAELVQAIQFLHDLGAVQFFDTDFLRSMVVIYPQWIIDVMACLVTVHEGSVKNGKLLLKDIGKVWKDYPEDLHPWLLRLTEEFDLTCPLFDEEASIVPCLLPDEEPKYDWPHADPEKLILESMTQYKFQYLPAGLFNRAQVRLNQYAKGAMLWKKGSFMRKNNHIALMLQTDDQEVVVRAQGFKPDNFLFIVHEMFETLINESYAGVQYDFLLPCMDCLNMNVKDPSMMSYNKIQRALELNVPFVQCEKFFHILSIQELKDAMPSDKMSDMDNHLRNSVRELIDLTEETIISVFFIFSSKNVLDPNDKESQNLVRPGTILEDLKNQKNFKISYTDNPESSNMEALSLSMKSTNVIIIGMSDEFCDDPECRKLLLYVKNVLRKPVLLLLLGKTKRWQKSDLNMEFGTEVYVDMQNKGRYQHKIVELYDAIKKKAAAKKLVKIDSPKCFISYCWTNSHDAIAKGSRLQEGALGWSGGDPREVKKFLEEKGVSCWIDIERVGGVGLFTSIADGLREAEVMVAFVSDEYVKSKNCMMEFRYGLTTLRIPVIVVVCGTGYQWERSEIGLLAVGHSCPKINFQYTNDTGNLELLKLVQENITTDTAGKDENQALEKQRNVAFQEVMELTQRKFLRHMTTTVSSNDTEPFPVLFLVDLLSEKEKQDWETETRKTILAKRKADAENEEKKASRDETKDEKGDEKDIKEDKKDAGKETKEKDEAAELEAIDVSDVCKSKFCFRILCENQVGWHMVGSSIPFPVMDPADEQQLIDNAAPYLARVFAICKHSNIQLMCLTTPQGEIFQQRIEEIGIKSASDFKAEYIDLREVVMQQDKNKVMNTLHRCLVNGKMVWLCETHKQASKSKTEKMYDQLTGASNIPIPVGDIPEVPVAQEQQESIVVMERAEKASRPHRRVFKHESGMKPRGVQRQTSQMCSVM